LPAFAHEHVFLQERMHVRRGRYIHDNPDVAAELRRFAPDVVLSTGYNPTHLRAWLYALLQRRPHVVMTDGTDRSEAGLSVLHRAVRRMVFAGSQAFVVASDGGERLLRGYGVPAARIHRSPLCANTDADWAPAVAPPRDIDLLFSGRLVPVKNPDFALRVAQELALRLQRRVSLTLLGHGPMLEALRNQAPLLAPQVDVHFAGHVAQAEMPHWFLRARLFVFPTLWDPWGVVANEACLAGVPVLVSPHAGAAGELVRDGLGGRVLALDAAQWAAAALELLSDPLLHARQSQAARQAVAPYNFDAAAAGIIDAACAAAGAPRR
jgi:glycosyltransferase involved in cell wall biosynthesis